MGGTHVVYQSIHNGSQNLPEGERGHNQVQWNSNQGQLNNQVNTINTTFTRPVGFQTSQAQFVPVNVRPSNVIVNGPSTSVLNGSKINNINTSNVVVVNRNLTNAQDNTQRSNIVLSNPPLVISNPNVHFRSSLQTGSQVNPVHEFKTVRAQQFIQSPVFVRP